MSDADGVGPVIRRDGNGVIIRQEDFFNNQYGGGTAIRGNFATPLMGGKSDLTARYGVNDYHVNFARTNQAFGNFQGLFAIIGLGDEQFVHLNTQAFRIFRIKGAVSYTHLTLPTNREV